MIDIIGVRLTVSN